MRLVSMTTPAAAPALLALVLLGIGLSGCTTEKARAAAAAPASSPSDADAVAGRPVSVLPDLPDGDMSVRWEVTDQDPASQRVTIAAATGCEEDPPVQVAETAEAVTIRVVIPDALDPYFCGAAPVERTVTLASPLGDRPLQPAPLDAG